MPRLKLRPNENADRELLTAIERQKTRFGYDNIKVSKFAQISPSTFYNKLRKPEGFTLKEMRLMVPRLKLTDRDVCAALGVTYHGSTVGE